MARPLRRLTTQVAVDDGVLKPLDAWRLEEARGETRVHRQLARLAEAGDAAIAGFASRYGLLRLAASSLVNSQPEAHWQEQALRMGQYREDEIEAALRWARNPTLPYPAQAAGVLGGASFFAEFLPAVDLDAMASFFGDAPLEEVRVKTRHAAAAADVPPLPVVQLFEAASPGARPVRPSPALVTALEAIQHFGQQLARESSFDDRPDSAAFAPMLAAVLQAVPAALPDPHFASESVAHWREIAASLAEWIEMVDFLREAAAGRLVRRDRVRLERLLDKYAEWRTPVGRSQAELADLAGAVVRARLELALTDVGAWPPSVNTPTGLFARALLHLWQDLTDERWPKRCAEAGCRAALAGHRKNRLCPAHATQRQRRRVAARQRTHLTNAMGAD